MDRARMGKIVNNALSGVLLLVWILTAFYWMPHLPDLVRLLWVPFLIGVLFLLRPLKVLEYWIAGQPNPRQRAREYEVEGKIKAQDDTSFGG